ncbi:hypothetical protein SK128_013626 [Halocaridina rubra]|uniref:Peroxinectin n=1 Tax=Halocaridina rubra TaxID=373956 RepID=A0AAN9A0X0_HALRR
MKSVAKTYSMKTPLISTLFLVTVALKWGTAQEATELENDNETPAEDDKILHSGRVIRQIIFPGRVSPGGGRAPQSGRPAVFATASVSRPQSGNCNCVAMINCASEIRQVQNSCTLSNAAPGVCCPPSFLASNNPPRGTGDSRVLAAPRANVNLGPVDANVIIQALQKGISAYQTFQNTEQDLIRQRIYLERGSPASGHLRFFTVSPGIAALDQNALTIAMASKNILNDLSLSRSQADGLRNMQVSNTILGHTCPRAPACSNPNSKYRTADGSCNNLNNPSWGMMGTPVQRIVPPKYDDGVIDARSRSVDGSPLPRERVIASNILVDVDNPDVQYTSSVIHWSQFLDHDFTHTPFPMMPNGEGIECCPNGRMAPANQLHPRCLPIDLTGDAFFAQRGRNCMNFVRSMLAVGAGTECTFGPAEQVNQLTAWIDGSMVYGSNVTQTRNLRTGRDGLLSSSGNRHLPIARNQGGSCEAGDRNAQCFMAGDSRSNESPGLTATHIVWHREHNRIARALRTLNPTWSDEALFQETRRIIIAQLQHITYNEFLPAIVGPNFMRAYGINTRLSGYSNDYNPRINPTINNEFGTAAYRFGHSMVQGIMRLFSPTGQVSSIQLRDHFNSPHLIQQNPQALDMILRSFTQQATQQFDSFVSRELTNHLFQTPKFNFGMDLMSINIHRGRDHAIGTYNEIRQICGLPRARTFNDIKDQIPAQIANNLARIYRHVDDIDFFVGGIVERPVSGGVLGWTFLCVVGDQFARLKKGDRYFYDLGGQPGSFTGAQLQEIRRTSWARVLCDNGDNLQIIQPLAFQLANSRFNQPVPCGSPIIPRMDLTQWRGERPAA